MPCLVFEAVQFPDKKNGPQASRIISSKSLVLEVPLPEEPASDDKTSDQSSNATGDDVTMQSADAEEVPGPSVSSASPNISASATSPLSPSPPSSGEPSKESAGLKKIERKRKRVEINRSVVALDWNSTGSR